MEEDTSKCMLCGGVLTPFFKEERGLLRCGSCGLGTLGEVAPPGEEDLTEYYKKERGISLSKEKIASRRRNVRQRIDLIKGYLKGGDDVLDIGCGEGLFMRSLEGTVGSVKGIEPSHEAAAFGAGKGLEIKEGFIEDGFFEGERFDMVTAFHVLEHMPDPRDALKRIRGYLKEGGWAVIEVPDIESPYARYRGSRWDLICDEHIFYYNERSLRRLLEEGGFRVVKCMRRDFDQFRQGVGRAIRKMTFSGEARYYGSMFQRQSLGSGDRGIGPAEKRISPFKRFRRSLELPLRWLLGYLLLKAGKSDYLFVVAQKTGAQKTGTDESGVIKGGAENMEGAAR